MTAFSVGVCSDPTSIRSVLRAHLAWLTRDRDRSSDINALQTYILHGRVTSRLQDLYGGLAGWAVFRRSSAFPVKALHLEPSKGKRPSFGGPHPSNFFLSRSPRPLGALTSLQTCLVTGGVPLFSSLHLLCSAAGKSRSLDCARILGSSATDHTRGIAGTALSPRAQMQSIAVMPLLTDARRIAIRVTGVLIFSKLLNVSQNPTCRCSKVKTISVCGISGSTEF